MTVHVTIALDEAVKAKLDALADSRRVPVDEIVAAAVSEMAAEDAAFLAAVAKGLKSVAEGRVHSHEAAVAAVRAQQAERKRVR